MAENLSFPIPKEILEPFIKEAVSVSIIAALGDGTKLVTYAVEETLRKKVDSSGVVSKYSSDNKYNLIDILAQKEIRAVAIGVIKETVAQLRPRIEAGIIKALNENAESLGEVLCDKYLNDLYKDLGVVRPKKKVNNSCEDHEETDDDWN